MRTIKHNLGNKDGEFAVSYKDRSGTTRKAKFTGVVLSAPADSDALANWHRSKTFSFGAGSEKIEFSGLEAAAAAKVLHDIETVRGKAREKLAAGASHDAVQTWLRTTMLNYWPGDSVSATKATADQDRIAEYMAAGDLAGLQQYLVDCGVVVAASADNNSEDTDEDPIAAEAARMAAEVDRRLAEQDDQDEDDTE